MEAECCVQDVLGSWLYTVDTGILPVFSRKLEHLFLGFGLKATVCLMSQSHPALRLRELLLLEQLLAPRMCVLAAEQVTLGDADL